MSTERRTFPFYRVKVRSRTSGGGTSVTWEFDPLFQDPLPHVFTLQGARTDADAGDYENIGLSVTNTYYLVDPEDRHLGDEQDFHYRVKLVTPNGTYYSAPVDADHRLSFRDWRIARDIIRKEVLRHDLFVSLKGWLLKRRIDGPKCNVCLNSVGACDDSRCPTCYGTRFQGGYFAPDVAFLQLEVANSKIATDLDLATVQESPTIERCRMLGDPEPKSKDVFVDGETDRRYLIDTIQTAAMIRSFPAVTTVLIKPIGLNDIVYDFPVPDVLPETTRDTLTPDVM